MSARRHTGYRAQAKNLTIPQLEELFTIALTTKQIGRATLLSAKVRQSPETGPLIERKLISWQQDEPGSAMRAADLTERGWLVLLNRLDDEMTEKFRAARPDVAGECEA